MDEDVKLLAGLLIEAEMEYGERKRRQPTYADFAEAADRARAMLGKLNRVERIALDEFRRRSGPVSSTEQTGE